MMFIIATTYALALENNDIAIFNFDGTFPHKDPSVYVNNIFRNLTMGNIQNPVPYNDPDFSYTEIPYQEHLYLNGYFQSEKYFEKYREEIRLLFSPPLSLNNYLLKKYEFLFNYNLVSMHIRHGDYALYPKHHPMLNLKYYNEAARYFEGKYKDIKFLIFSDDISWCKDNFDHSKCVFIEERDYIELYLMSMCDHNIISNSSFSWWAAWLDVNGHKDKEIIAPKNWFGEDYKNMSTEDLIPKKWIRI